MHSSVPPAQAALPKLDWLELQAINEVEGLSNILRLVLLATGLKFAAIGKFTDQHWVAYLINDSMHLGLKPGDVIPNEVALCHKVQQERCDFIIPCASKDPIYKDHPAIVNFGFGSYVSLPVYLANGELFGSLCATGPDASAQLMDGKVIESLRLFSRLSGQLLSSNLAHV